MTTEQYKRAVEINDRLKELEYVKKRICSSSKSPLTYCDMEYDPRHRWLMNYIFDDIDHYIRAEIDDEIEKLKKEIEEL